jgi:ADP-dependent NAD(P)H-hydrate dehydratase / NAD(P)H-hydrate epimerase
MIPVLTSAETAALDRETEARGTPVEALMERAGRAVARAVVDVLGGTYGRRIVVVCGKGNNGGDGLVAARVLSAWGASPAALLLADPGELKGPAASAFKELGDARWAGYSADRLARELGRADAAIDAIFGTGFRGSSEGPHAEAMEALNASGVPVVAVDIPSGVEGDTGAVRGPAVRASITVTFGGPKVGDVLHPGAKHAGDLRVVDIGFPEDLLHSDVGLVEGSDVRSMLPRRGEDSHKRRSGVVLVVAGSRRMTGAPQLVAMGALRAGAGLVTVAVPEGALGAVQAGVAESTYLPLPEGSEGAVAEEAWGSISDRLGDFDAVALGPGLSTDGGASALARRIVGESPVPVVVDADALNAFAGRPAELASRRSEAVLTPHTGELGRLFRMPVQDVLDDRVGMVRKCAAETQATVVLKGSRSLIGTPDGRIRVSPTGSRFLATGGTGDVLTGAIAALLARGIPPADAATAAAYAHGIAGRLAGETMGEGTTASDVALHLAPAFAGLAEDAG